MSPRTQTWTHSAHAVVACVKCHQTPTPWYALPQRLVGRGELLARERDARDRRLRGPRRLAGVRSDPVQDEVCLQCHDVNRKATSGFRIIIDHAEHAKRNGSCVSCHVRTAHPVDTRGTAISLMSQCFTCHGTAEKPKASASAGSATPPTTSCSPNRTRPPRGSSGHGKAAKADPKQCGMCHAKAFCDDCHGVQMPHPKGWATGATGHAATAQLNRAPLRALPWRRLDMCTMCHHTPTSRRRARGASSTSSTPKRGASRGVWTATRRSSAALSMCRSPEPTAKAWAVTAVTCDSHNAPRLLGQVRYWGHSQLDGGAHPCDDRSL